MFVSAERHRKKLLRSPRWHRRGATIVEVALVLPLLFTLILTAYEFGRLGMLRQEVDNVAYEVARYATRTGATQEQAMAYGERQLSTLGVRNAQVIVEPAPESGAQQISVTLSVNLASYGWITPVLRQHKEMYASCSLPSETAATPNASAVRASLSQTAQSSSISSLGTADLGGMSGF